MLRRRQQVAVLVAPWTFVAVFSSIWLGVLVPRALAGPPIVFLIGVLAGCVLVTFWMAAVTFSRDVLGGRWPPQPDAPVPPTAGLHGRGGLR
jgi:hypothetical protein